MLGDETKTSYEKPFKTMRLDHASLAFSILLVLTGIVKTSPAENKVMREQRAVHQMDTNGTNIERSGGAIKDVGNEVNYNLHASDL